MEYKLTYKSYADALREGNLLGLKCNECQAYTAPPKKVCMEYAGEDVEIVQLSGKGKVQTFTVVRMPPEGFEEPYVVALVELSEGPWVMGNIVGVDASHIGMELIGKEVTAGCQVLPGDKFSNGDKVALCFSLNN